MEGQGSPFQKSIGASQILIPTAMFLHSTPTANLNKLTEAWFKPHLWPMLFKVPFTLIRPSSMLIQVKTTSAGGRWTAPEVSDSQEPELQPPLCSVPSLRCLRASGCGHPCRPLPGGRAPWPRTGRCRRKTAWPHQWRWRQIVPLYCSGWKKRESVRWRVNLGHSRRGRNLFFLSDIKYSLFL